MIWVSRISKQWTWPDKKARYIKYVVKKSKGGFFSAAELQPYKVDGTEGYLVGDTNNDGVVDDNDLVQINNYVGLENGDPTWDQVKRSDWNANGYFDSMNADARYELRKQLNAQRTEDARNGSYALAGGVVDPLPVDAPQFLKDYHSYYKTERGYHKRSLNSNNGWNKTSSLSFINMPILSYSDEIRSAVLMLHGEKAHSRYFSEDAFKKLKGGNKELLIIPDASHVDLYDNLNVIPFDRIERFFREYLKWKILVGS